MADLRYTPIDQITFADVAEFCEARVQENVLLDYKQGFSPKPKKASEQIAKIVSAMANAQGGMILWGVAEGADRYPATPVQGKDLGANPKSKIQSVCYGNIYPPIMPEVSDFLPSPTDPKRGVVVVRVYKSDQAPHTLNDREDIYRRVADQSEPRRAKLEEIEWMIRERERGREIAEQRKNEAYERLLRYLGLDKLPRDATRPFYTILCYPAFPVATITELSRLHSEARSWRPDGAGPREMLFEPNSAIKSCPDGIVTSWDFAAHYATKFGLVGIIRFCDNERGFSGTTFNLSHTTEHLLEVLGFAKEFYQAVGYHGLVCIECKFECIQRNIAIWIQNPGRDASATPVTDDACKEPEIRAIVDTDTGELAREWCGELAVKVLNQLFWALGQPNRRVAEAQIKSYTWRYRPEDDAIQGQKAQS